MLLPICLHWGLTCTAAEEFPTSGRGGGGYEREGGEGGHIESYEGFHSNYDIILYVYLYVLNFISPRILFLSDR